MNAKSLPHTMPLAAVLAVCSAAIADDSPAPRKDLSWVQQRVADWQPAKDERAFEDIGWAGGLLEAQRLAKEHGRGIFLFTYDGTSLAGHRC